MNAILAIYAETHGLTKVTGTPLHHNIWRNELVKATSKEMEFMVRSFPTYHSMQEPTSMPALMNRVS